MATARDLCREALEDAGIVAIGEAIDNNILTNALKNLNNDLEVLNKQKLFPAYEVVTELTLPSAQREYTIGVGGDISVISRPIDINWLKIKNGDTWYTPVKKTLADFGEYSNTSNTQVLPSFYYYNPTYPLGTLGFFNSLDVAYYVMISVNVTAGPYLINDTISLVEGYYPLLKWRLAATLCDINGKDSTMQWARANDIEATIKRLNNKPKDAKRDIGSLWCEERRILFP